MANTAKAISRSCHSPDVRNKIPVQITSKLNSEITTSSLPVSTIDKWSLAHDQALVSTPLKHFNYQTGDPSFAGITHIEHAKKLKILKHILSKIGEDDPFECFAMIDAIQRLGIDHHFQYEIKEVLQKHYRTSSSYRSSNQGLLEVSLRFRLLRQEGFYVPESVFSNFKGKDGKFQHRLNEDIKGLMGLYEASRLSIEGEDTLDEAGEFSAQLLRAWIANLDHYEARVVRNTLDHPHHKSLSRFMAKNFLTHFHGTNGWKQILQELVQMDFNIIQSLHRDEIAQISKWWKELGLVKELEFARDQPLKWYIWSMASLTDHSLSEIRVDLTKPISLVYIIDDIFDVYGSLDDLTLFTEAVDSWDYERIQRLPDCMKVCFNALDKVTNEISLKVYKKHGWNPVDSLRQTWASLCIAFLVEAKWFALGHLPESEEYLKNGIVSSGAHVVIVHMFFLLGQGINKETVELINNTPGPGIISSVATILRLWDDLGSAKDENQDGHDGSYVECYMKEHQGSTVDDARNQVIGMISDEWKRLNQECLNLNPFSATFTKGCLNLARMVPLVYNYDENHSLPGLEDYMKSLL